MKAQALLRWCKPGIIPGRETCASKKRGEGEIAIPCVRPDLSEILRARWRGTGCWYRERQEGGVRTYAEYWGPVSCP
jgi:hypothetical protein